MSRLRTWFAVRPREIGAVLAVAVVAAVFVVAALADAPDVTNTTNYSNLGFAPNGASVVSVAYDPTGLGGQGTTTVTIKGGWAWPTHGHDCNTDRAGAGYAIAWSDPNDAGYPLGNTGISVGSQNPHGFAANTDANVVQPTPSAKDPSNPAAVRTVSTPASFKSWGGGCGRFSTGTITGWKGGGAAPTTFSQGFWGPISHTYVGSPATLPSKICAVTYDVHPGTAAAKAADGLGIPGGAKEITSGGAGYNDDDSVEKNGQTPAGNVCASITPPSPTIDLAVTKVGSPARQELTSSSQIAWTMVVTNNGPSVGTGVQIADAIPADNTFVSATSTQGTCTGGSILHCTIGTMAVGGKVTISLVTKPGVAETVTNTVTVVGNEPETNYNNNTATASVVVTGPITPPPPACVAVSRVSPSQLFVGRRATLTIHVTRGGHALKGIRVHVKGPKLDITTKPSNAKGVVRRTVKMKKAGVISIAPVATPNCGTRLLGVTNVITPPVTG
jgi:uncharacterized repeat protein (TIGR01451 family)